MELLSSFIQLNTKHVFSREEMEQQGLLLAQAVQDKANEEANKKLAMGTFKDKIDKLSADIKVFSGHVANGFTYRDEPCEVYLDYDNNERVYARKSDGLTVKRENFHASDYQKKIDFEGLQEQIDENNETGDYAEDALGNIIENKKSKPKPKDNLKPDYGKDFDDAE